MANADDLTRVGMEIIVQGTKLTAEALLKILESITKLFERNKENRDYIINDNTKEGKQKIKDLVRKHKDGVMAFDENVSKEQMNDYVKDFKKLGVDFSVVKNEKDSFSFFFASKDANVIEKALKNVVEKKNRSLESEKKKKADKELETDFIDEKENPEPPIEEEKIINNEKEKIKFDSKEQQLDHIFKQLSPEERNLFMQLNKFEVESLNNHFADSRTYVESEKYKELAESFSDETIENVADLYYKNISTEIRETPDGKIHMDELHNVVENLEKGIELKKESAQERQPVKFDSKEQQLDHVFKQLSPEEKNLFMQLNKVKVESLNNHFADSTSHVESHKYQELVKSFSDESRSKVAGLYHKNISTEIGETPDGKIHMDELRNVVENLEKGKQVQTEKQEPNKPEKKQGQRNENKTVKPQEYSMKAVKAIDTKLKEQENSNKDKKRTQEVSR